LFLGDPEWRSHMWGSIVALHGRYPHELAHLKDGWWKDAAHVEVLCALVVWRDWIDEAAATCTGGVGFAYLSAPLTRYAVAVACCRACA
jgi:hypothetical protein